MPSSSPKQARMMAAVARGWQPTEIDGPPRYVAQEFAAADQARAARTQRLNRGKAVVPPPMAQARVAAIKNPPKGPARVG